ncbi:Hexokinase type 2, partial [Trichinella papuae]
LELLNKRKMFAIVQFITEALKRKKQKFTLESVLAEFILDNDALRRMMYIMDREMTSGLAGGLKDSTIAMLPSFVPVLPDGTECGKYMAIDLGGTNLRVMLMHIAANADDSSAESCNFRMPQNAMTGTGEELFDFIAGCMETVLRNKNLLDEPIKMGFTFSYPCDQTSLRSAKLLRWTKGFNASGVEGEDVVKLLQTAIHKRNLKITVMALMNDTVGTQVATAHDMRQCELGVIVATGTNASYMEDVKKIPKLKGVDFPYEKMIIDTEWGGFGDGGEAEFIKTQYDRIVDERSVHPGVQCFDKMVAGMYMGELVRLVVEKLVKGNLIFRGVGSQLLFTPNTFPTKFISEILADEGGNMVQTRQILDELGIETYVYSDLLVLREVCMTVSRRSANLCAAAIACVLNRIGKKKAIVGIDGSTYRFHPFLHSWVKDKVRELLDPNIDFHLVQAGDGSGRGAALVAAIADKLNLEENVWHLSKQLIQAFPSSECRVCFLTNCKRKVSLWHQRTGDPNFEGFVVWDYHVFAMLHHDEQGELIFDLDTTLQFPCSAKEYVEKAIRPDCESHHNRRLFRVVDAKLYVEKFASDRSHMISPETYSHPPPWPIIVTHTCQNNLSKWLEVAVDRCPHTDSYGCVFDLEHLLFVLQD